MEGIKADDVKYSYPNGAKALDGVSFGLTRGESVALLGPNGAGKTTMVKLLNGLIKPVSGKVVVDGLDTRDIPVSKLARKVGIVFQNAEKQFFAETVFDELAFAPQNMGFKPEEVKAMVTKVASTFGIDQHLQRSPFSLSGGEKKRLSIASVLVCDPPYVVIDEPTVGLDYRYRKLLVDVIGRIVDDGKTVIVVTHDVDFALVTSRRGIMISGGQILSDGPIYEILKDDEKLEAASLVPTYTLRVIRSLIDKRLETVDITEAINFMNWGGKAP